jgi:hypothetical protein
LTKEQIASNEQAKLKKTLEMTTQELTTERNLWRDRFHTSQIQQAITSEAATAKAFDPDALIAILGPQTRLVEEHDENDQPTGKFVPKTKIQDFDAKEKKPVTLELTIPEAVKLMKEKAKYGYLFESTATPGVGSNTRGNRGGDIDPAKMSTEQYREWRKKNGMQSL